MTSATRALVHTAPMKPCASALRASRSGMVARCSAVSRGALPGNGRRRNASRPPSRVAFSHWLTAPRVTPSASAMRIAFQPCSCLPVYHIPAVLFSPQCCHQ